MIDKNLFLYDLAVVAIFKNEARYLKEWLDYHLLAGVDHFFLYNNDSSDDFREVLAPYVKKNLVTLTDWPGKLMMYPAYYDAIEKFRFTCRFMAFIDLDEFIFPKNKPGGGISEVVDKILSRYSNAAGLGINWQCFGSNGHEKADYSRGVLERFTRRAPSDWESDVGKAGNFFKKVIDNPRLIRYRINPHFSYYFDENYVVNSNGEPMHPWYGSEPILIDKIVINHYYTKSREEFEKKKMPKGSCCMNYDYVMENFYKFDRNEIFDDGILKYRAAREKNFSLESDEQKISRVINSLVRTLTQNPPAESKLETFLTCRAVAEKFQIKIGDTFAEEFALAWIYRTLPEMTTRAQVQMFLCTLPEILSRPFPVCKEILRLTQSKVIPKLCKTLKNGDVMTGGEDWQARSRWQYVQKLLRLIKL